MVGDLLELHCEAQRGSSPILYWFYHEDVILGTTSAPFGGGASLNLLLTTEHSGNYSCGADNGLGVQRSYMVTLNFTGGMGAPELWVAVKVNKIFFLQAVQILPASESFSTYTPRLGASRDCADFMGEGKGIAFSLRC